MLSPEFPEFLQEEMFLAAAANMTYICTMNHVLKEVIYG